MSPLSLAGKTAVVTGASRRIGIGAAIARELAEAGADLFVTYYRPYDVATALPGEAREPEQLLAELRGAGVRAAASELDLSDPSAPATLFDRVEETLGPVDVLVNNAAHSRPDGVDGLDAAGLDQHYAVNLRATALLCVEFARRRRGRSGGRIINITSGQGLAPMPGELAYAATKGAVDALTVSLAAEVAGRGITVSAVDPGPTDTGWMTEDLRQRLAASAPLGRVGSPRDAAHLVRFLACEESGWITGQILRSRGGF